MYAMKVDDAQAMHWTEVPDPVPKGGEVLLKIRAAALNRADLFQRAGKYPPPPGWPEWMGLEVAGVVLSAPAGSRWKAGDEVCALLGGGGYAEMIAVPEGMVLPVPAGLSMAEAASLPEVFATAYLNLFLEAHMREGETVFVQAGASGLGLAAIQLAKAFGAKVMTSVGSPEKAEAVRRIAGMTRLRRLRRIRWISRLTASAVRCSGTASRDSRPAAAGSSSRLSVESSPGSAYGRFSSGESG